MRLPHICAVFGFAVAVLIPATVSADPQLPNFDAPFYSFGLSSLPVGIMVGDFNGDGRTDVVLRSDTSRVIRVLPGGPGLSFGAPVAYVLPGAVVAIATGDFDGDGLPDLVAGGNGFLSVLRNTGSAFAAPVTTSLAYPPSGIAVGDVNEDGAPDLLTANDWGGTMSVFLNTGTGAFPSATTSVAQSSVTNVSIGDFDNDSHLDVIIGSWARHGNGDGTFAAPVQAPAPGHLVDMNGDGNLDLVFEWMIFRGLGNGTFGANLVSGTGSTSDGPSAVGDLDGDGRLDLVAIVNNAIRIYHQHGPGVFSLAGDVPSSFVISDVVLAPLAWGTPGAPLSAFTIGRNSVAQYCVSVHVGHGDSLLASLPKFPVHGTIPGAALTDLDGDGRRDIVVAGAGFGYGGLRWIFNDGTPDFGPLDHAFALSFKSLGVGELSGDGDPFVALTRAGSYPQTNPAVSLVRFDRQNHRFESQLTEIPVGWNVNGSALGTIVMADFNHDQRSDIAVLETQPVGIAVLLATGAFTFTAPVELPTTATLDLAAVDLNDDGNLDLVVRALNMATEFLGDGLGGFGPGINVALPGPFMRFARLDADTRVDLVSFASDTLVTMLGTGTGAFGARHDQVLSNPGTPAIADFDGDGVNDMVMTSGLFLHGNGDGTFAPFTGRLFGGMGELVLPAADLDGDGGLDLVTSFGFDGATKLGVLWSASGLVSAPLPTVPSTVALAARPNPARAGATLDWTMPVAGRVSLRVYDAAGRRVRTLVSGHLAAGAQSSRWNLTREDGSRAAAGIYFAVLSGAKTQVTRIVVLE